jgi:hypothetical protein
MQVSRAARDYNGAGVRRRTVRESKNREMPLMDREGRTIWIVDATSRRREAFRRASR